MTELANTFSWSHSRDRMFRECLRRYYWNYYGSWGGWRAVAPREARLAYQLKQVQSVKMWVGDIVHRVVENALRAIRAGQTPEAAALREEARRIMNREWAQSLSGDWKRDPKRNTNLFEHFYGQEITAEDRAELRERAFACLDAFMTSDALARIRQAGPKNWLALEDLTSFKIMEFPVWVKLDMAIRHGDGRSEILDWKTGMACDADWRQAQTYALFAMDIWKTPPETVDTTLVYLKEGCEDTRPVEAAALINQRDQIMASMADMLDALDDRDRNVASMSQFPMTGRPERCGLCNFRRLCFGDADPAEADV